MSDQPILILGGGPAGLAAAWKLARRGFPVVLAERAHTTGGNAGSFDVDGQAVDFGSHRLHPSCDQEILADIKSFLGEDLLDRPRHGRIRLGGCWLHFPLKPADIVMHAPRAFAAGALRDMVWKPRRDDGGPESFASVLEAGLGPTICREFYFPYAQKIWGVDAAQLDAEQARRRVSAGTLLSLIRKIASPGKKGRFYYPRHGFGQIGDAYANAARTAGARILTGTTAESIDASGGRVHSVRLKGPTGTETLRPALVLSTIALPQLARCFAPGPPDEVLAAAAGLSYRAMLLIYLVLETDQFSEFDAHYFPEPEIGITRLSEPKNYGLTGPKGQTVLCAELPCAADRGTDESELREVVLGALGRAGIPVRCGVRRVVVRRLAQAYPVYLKGFREDLIRVKDWVDGIEGVVSLGRQGLFAHDNTHHTVAMAYAAEGCVGAGGVFDRERWAGHLRRFEGFVVED